MISGWQSRYLHSKNQNWHGARYISIKRNDAKLDNPEPLKEHIFGERP